MLIRILSLPLSVGWADLTIAITKLLLMKRITTQIVTLLLAYVLTISLVTAQTVSSSSNLSVFYPAGYDATQNTPSFAIQNEPVVNPGAQSGWKLNPTFSISGSNNIATVNCGTGVDFYGTGEVTGHYEETTPVLHYGTQITILMPRLVDNNCTNLIHG